MHSMHWALHVQTAMMPQIFGSKTVLFHPPHVQAKRARCEAEGRATGGDCIFRLICIY